MAFADIVSVEDAVNLLRDAAVTSSSIIPRTASATGVTSSYQGLAGRLVEPYKSNPLLLLAVDHATLGELSDVTSV